MKEPEKGDYVLGTKWHDGNPGDPWAVGFLGEKWMPARRCPARWGIYDDKNQLIGSDYRRVKKISINRGR